MYAFDKESFDEAMAQLKEDTIVAAEAPGNSLEEYALKYVALSAYSQAENLVEQFLFQGRHHSPSNLSIRYARSTAPISCEQRPNVLPSSVTADLVEDALKMAHRQIVRMDWEMWDEATAFSTLSRVRYAMRMALAAAGFPAPAGVGYVVRMDDEAANGQ